MKLKVVGYLSSQTGKVYKNKGAKGYAEKVAQEKKLKGELEGLASKFGKKLGKI